MGYFIISLFLIFNLLSNFVQAYNQKFGQYGYTNYAALNNQLQYNRARAIQRNRYYNQSPTRNIIIPRGAIGTYPNIEKNYSRNNYQYQRQGYNY